MHTIQSYLDMLGYKVRDKITQFEGTAESVAFDLYGCVLVVVRPLMPPGADQEKLRGMIFDHKRLERTGEERAMPLPTFIDVQGPADRSSIC